jgi:hypothetical protein
MMDMRCPICGDTLKDQVKGCSTCPMHPGSCKMLCCENCGYETVAPVSATVEFFKRLLHRGVPVKRAS